MFIASMATCAKISRNLAIWLEENPDRAADEAALGDAMVARFTETGEVPEVSEVLGD